MRELVFKNLVSANSHKKDIYLKEIFEKNGIVAKIERRCFYFIKDMAPFNDLEKLTDPDKTGGKVSAVNNRRFHIFKSHDDGVGEDKVICKMMGNLYVLLNGYIYTIAFLHSLKMSFVKPTLTN